MAHRAARDPNAVDLWTHNIPGAQGNGLEDTPRLTPMLVDSSEPAAAVVVCPGGGYNHRADHEGEPVGRWLNSLGIAAFVLDYRVSPYRHPAPLQDAQRAIRMVRHQAETWRIDPRRIGILGFSAGGHLAISAATIFDDGDASSDDPIQRQSCRPDAFISCYAVVTLDSRYHHGGSRRALLGETPPQSLISELSLHARVTDRTPPAFIWHTAEDKSVPVQNSLMLAHALGDRGVPFSLHVFPKGNHGMGLAASNPIVSAWTQLCADWLGEIGFRS